ncbi:MAG: efflux RND transporter periplasmic adaptor subunit, partial [Isosphaeraceae bacterium]
LLFEIDPRPYKAELDRTKSTLKQAEARLKRQEQNFRRVATLFGNNARSRDEYDQAEDDYLEAQASVGIAAANVATAELNMTFTKVTAPLSGRLSRRMADVGNLVKADDTTLMQIEDIHQLYVVYDVDERNVLKIREMIREGTFRPMSEGKLTVDIALADDPDFSHPFPGTVNFSETNLDPNSGTLRLRADIDNPTLRPNGLRSLSPGQFVKVRLPLGPPFRSLSIPEESLMSDQGKKYIYLFRPLPPEDQAKYREDQVKELDARAAQAKPGAPVPPARFFRGGTIAVAREKERNGQGKLVLGPLRDGRRVIREGLAPGEEVVVTGLQGIRPGGEARVEIKPGDATPPALPAGPERPRGTARRRAGRQPATTEPSK